MAKIRSVHPGLWTDENFAGLSADAQIFLIGLTTEADDFGIFEWKPVTLRMRLRPTKDGSVEPILAELQEARWIRSYEINGRKLGAIRNFTKWQTPRFPKSIHLYPPEIGKFIGLTSPQAATDTVQDGQQAAKEVVQDGALQRNAENDAVQDCELQRNVENPSLLLTATKQTREIKKEPPIRPPKGAVSSAGPRKPKPEPPGFAEFYEAFPKHEARGAASKAYAAALKKVSNSELLEAAHAFRAERRGEDEQFTPRAATWLNAERWADESLQTHRPAMVLSLDQRRIIEAERVENAKWEDELEAARQQRV